MHRKIQLIGLTLALVVGSMSPLLAGTPDYPLQDIEGKTRSLTELRGGKPSVLIFWATWCGHCRAEIPKIKEAFGNYGKSGINFLAIDAGVRDSLARVQRYVTRYSLDYPVYFDPHQKSRVVFGLKGTPTIILLDAEGREVSRSESVDLEAISKLMR